jgi:hypothetical protein
MSSARAGDTRPIRIAIAIRAANEFRAAMRRMLAYDISQKSNLPAAIDRGADAHPQVFLKPRVSICRSYRQMSFPIVASE